MLMREAHKDLRVQLTPEARSRQFHADWRVAGLLTSGRLHHSQPPYEEGLMLRVKWDGMPTPEYWHLADLERVSSPGAPEP